MTPALSGCCKTLLCLSCSRLFGAVPLRVRLFGQTSVKSSPMVHADGSDGPLPIRLVASDPQICHPAATCASLVFHSRMETSIVLSSCSKKQWQINCKTFIPCDLHVTQARLADTVTNRLLRNGYVERLVTSRPDILGMRACFISQAASRTSAIQFSLQTRTAGDKPFYLCPRSTCDDNPSSLFCLSPVYGLGARLPSSRANSSFHHREPYVVRCGSGAGESSSILQN